MSFGFNEGTGADEVSGAQEELYDAEITTPGVTFLAASGDEGTQDAGYPAFSPDVVAVGGTTLTINTDGSYVSEKGWSGSGGGQSQYESEPSYQSAVQTTGKRSIPDVAFLGDPETGVAIEDSYNEDSGYPWTVAAGTSLGTPCWAGLIAIIDQGRVATEKNTLDSTQTVNVLYALPTADFHNNLGGNNGTTTAGLTHPTRYDEVTGLGTPVANLLVPDMINGFAADIVLNSVSTQDANELTVNYDINTDLQSDGAKSFEIDIYRSDKPQYDAKDQKNVEVASYQVAGDELDEGSNQTIAIDPTSGSENSRWGISASTLAAPLVPDPQLPYVLAVVDPKSVPSGVLTDSSSANFRIYSVAAITHGQVLPGSSPSQWMSVVWNGLTAEGYIAVPVYWSTWPPGPGQCASCGDGYVQRHPRQGERYFGSSAERHHRC